jgi:hypothetical protein
MTAIIKHPSSWASIFHGQVCVGHVLHRGPAGYESFDAADKSLGTYPTRDDAVNALDRGQP